MNNQEFMKYVEHELAEKKAFCEANTAYKKRTSNVTTDKDKLEFLSTLYNSMPVNYETVISKKEFNSIFSAIDSYTVNEIFEDNFDEFLLRNPELKVRDIVKEEVGKAINCQKSSIGYTTFHCDTCDKDYNVPFTCKSKFCTSCAIKYQMDRAITISSKLLDCKHRHIVFTIPEELRIYFRIVPKLLDVLFKAAEDTILYYFKQLNKSKDFVPGIILVLHTFGRSLQWNPHIHTLVTEGGSSKLSKLESDAFRKVTHFNYELFRKSFQKTLLDRMKQELKKVLFPKDFNKFKMLVNDIYRRHESGFYVRLKPDYRDGKGAVNYLIRYFNRPVIASSRILFYDGTYVVFYYQRHEDDLFVIKKVHVDEFIKMLIIHIPEKNFKMLRYADIYSSHNKCHHLKNLTKKLSELCVKIMKQKANWRDRIKADFSRDPLICPHCSKILSFSNIYIAPRTC